MNKYATSLQPCAGIANTLFNFHQRRYGGAV